MATLTGTGLLNFYCRNIEGTYSADELQSFLTAEGDNVSYAFARALEVEATKVAYQFSAGDVSANKRMYYEGLRNLARQVRQDAFTYEASEVSSTVSWSGSAWFGTAEVQDEIDEEYGEPTW